MIFKKYIFQIPTESKSIQLIMADMEQGGEEGIQYVCEGSSFVCMTHERSGCPWSLCVCVCVWLCVCVILMPRMFPLVDPDPPEH